MNDQESTKKEKNVQQDKFKLLIEQIEQMSVLDLIELTKILQEKFGVSAIAQPIGMSVGNNGQEKKDTLEEEKAFFDIELQDIGTKKIEVIKAVRDITAKGLKESKDLVDAAVNEPQLIKEKVKKEEAEEIKKKLETAGAKVKLI